MPAPRSSNASRSHSAPSSHDRRRSPQPDRRPSTPGAESGTPPLDDPALSTAVDAAPDGLAHRELRHVLGIGPDTTPTQLSRLLADAVRRGVVARRGRGRSTVYVPAQETARDGSAGPAPGAAVLAPVRILHVRDDTGRWDFSSPDVPGMVGTAGTYEQSRARAALLLAVRLQAGPGPSDGDPPAAHFVDETAAGVPDAPGRATGPGRGRD
jgi:hypothetical protein